MISTWANVKNETEVSARSNHHLSNSAARMAINGSYILYWKGSVRMSAVVPRQNALGYRETGAQDGNGELADGKSLLAARVTLNAVAQWHSRCECPWMKHRETAGTGGDENMKGVGIVWVPTRDVCASDFGYVNNLKPLPNHHHRPTIERRWTTNLIESAELTRRPTWNSCGWNAMPPIQFLSPSRTTQINYQIKHGQNRYVVFGVWLSSAIHGGLKVTDGRVHE